MTPRGWLATTASLLCLVSGTRAAGPSLTPEEAASILSSLHEDYGRYIGEVRYGSSRLRPRSIYAGLVRPGGGDPRLPDDGPRVGRRAVNDLIIYVDTFEISASPAWRRLILDHEYFHARHLARGYPLPVVSFQDAAADTHYYEALAWGYVLDRAAAGHYGELTIRESAEVMSRYREHRSAFRAFVFERQPSAWAHYGRFLPPGSERTASIMPDSAAARAGTPPRADPAAE